MDLPVPTGQKSVIPLILLLLLLAVIAFFALGSLNLAGSTTQTGQCPPFNAQQEAFNLAQRTEQFRRAKPEAVNYGNGSYTICYTNGKIAYFTFPQPFRGFYDKNAPGEEYKTHSEQATYVWLGRKLAALPLVASQIQWIQVVIFSQVIVCPPCQNDMKSWQTGLRGQARIENLFLSIWDIGNNGFDPARYPAGTGKPVILGDVRQVDILFDS